MLKGANAVERLVLDRRSAAEYRQMGQRRPRSVEPSTLRLVTDLEAVLHGLHAIALTLSRSNGVRNREAWCGCGMSLCVSRSRIAWLFRVCLTAEAQVPAVSVPSGP